MVGRDKIKTAAERGAREFYEDKRIIKLVIWKQGMDASNFCKFLYLHYTCMVSSDVHRASLRAV